jgi:capsular polysaccharide biosynthesis protein
MIRAAARESRGKSSKEPQLDLRHAASVLWPHRLVLLAAIVVGGLAGVFVSYYLPSTYESEATLLVADASGRPPSGYEDLLAAEILARTYAELGHSTPVLTAALDGASIVLEPADLAERMIVEPIRNTSLIRIVARGGTATEAHALASALATEVSSLATTNEDGMRLVVVDPAEEPSAAVAPRVSVNAVVGAVIAFLGTAAVILIVGRPEPAIAPQATTFEEARRRSVDSDRFPT